MPVDSCAISSSDCPSTAYSGPAHSRRRLDNGYLPGVVDSQLAEESMIPLFLLLLMSFSVSASEPNRWFGRHEEGWFWYERLEEAEPEKEEKSEPAFSLNPQTLPVAWIRNNIGQYLDKAIDQPNKENVSRYLYLDRAVKEKAERFARVGKRVIESDPMLDENVRRPISPAAARINDDLAHQAKEQILKGLAKKAGLVFYYRGACSLCKLQLQTLRQLRALFDFELFAISTDGVILSDIESSRIEYYPSKKLNILRYPALYIMHPPDDVVLLRQGSISLAELTEKIIQVAGRHGWIDSDQFDKTRINSEVWEYNQNE